MLSCQLLWVGLKLSKVAEDMWSSMLDAKNIALERAKEFQEIHQSFVESQSTKREFETEEMQREGIPESIQNKVDEATALTANWRTMLSLISLRLPSR